jgi:hypothetical protein
MTKREAIAYRLLALLLAEGPLNCTRADLAVRLDASASDLACALYWLRKPKVIARHGWTVLYQPGGSAARFWQIIDSDDHTTMEERRAATSSNALRRDRMSAMARRTKAQVEHVMAATDKRTRDYAQLGRTAEMLGGAAAMLEEIGR